MSKHTPGPWTVRYRNSIYAKGDNFNPAPHGGKTCKECGHDESGCYSKFVVGSLTNALIEDIKEGYFDDFKDSEQTSQADLRLIAAAPDLLAALEALVHEYEPNIKTFVDNAPRKAKWMAAIDAIAKATGVQP